MTRKIGTLAPEQMAWFPEFIELVAQATTISLLLELQDRGLAVAVLSPLDVAGLLDGRRDATEFVKLSRIKIERAMCDAAMREVVRLIESRDG